MQKPCQKSGMLSDRIKIRLDRSSILGLRQLGLTKRGISMALQICERTIYRWQIENQRNGKKPGRPTKITAEVAADIFSSLQRNPFQKQEEMVKQIATTVKVHQSTICRFLRRKGWSRKKVTKIPALCDESRAEEWLKVIGGQRLEDFLALDETSFVTTSMGVSHGYTPKGSPCYYQRDARLKRERLTLLICVQPSDSKVVHHIVPKIYCDITC